MNKISQFLVVLLLAIVANNSFAQSSDCQGKTTLSIKNKLLTVEVADTERERRYGLMFRSSMGTDCGMLFVFQNTGVRTFTMRNTLIPLDIAFIAADGEIKEIFTMQPGVLRYPSKVESDYALEMNAGWFKANELMVGDTIAVLQDDIITTLDKIKE